MDLHRCYIHEISTKGWAVGLNRRPLKAGCNGKIQANGDPGETAGDAGPGLDSVPADEGEMAQQLWEMARLESRAAVGRHDMEGKRGLAGCVAVARIPPEPYRPERRNRSPPSGGRQVSAEARSFAEAISSPRRIIGRTQASD
jgi:hypothetical protein